MNSANELLKEKLTVENYDQLMTLANPKMYEFVKESISRLAFLSALWSVSQSAPLCKVWRLAYLFGIAMGVAIGSAMEAKAK